MVNFAFDFAQGRLLEVKVGWLGVVREELGWLPPRASLLQQCQRDPSPSSQGGMG